MSEKRSGTFYAKILLFGEYSILCDSMGLSIPFTHFKGELNFHEGELGTAPEFVRESNQSLKDFAAHLRELREKGSLLFEIDIDRLDEDIARGLFFESNIPQGYGIGSSGALVASLYSSYAIDPILPAARLGKKKVSQLRNIFAQMESYFHGMSSGIDPLNCYISHPLLIEKRDDIKTIGMKQQAEAGKGTIFLVNTGLPGNTGPMVNLFLEQCRDDGYLSNIRNELVPLTESCIKSIVKGDIDRFFYSLKGLSKFFLRHMEPMIPQRFHHLWKHGIETGEYYLKLCGSGGGGYLLGFTEDFEKTNDFFKKQEMELIPVNHF